MHIRVINALLNSANALVAYSACQTFFSSWNKISLVLVLTHTSIIIRCCRILLCTVQSTQYFFQALFNFFILFSRQSWTRADTHPEVLVCTPVSTNWHCQYVKHTYQQIKTSTLFYATTEVEDSIFLAQKNLKKKWVWQKSESMKITAEWN